MTALEVIAEHKRLSEQIATLEAERANLPALATDWERIEKTSGTPLSFVRRHLTTGGTLAMIIQQIYKKDWEYIVFSKPTGNEWRLAEPNTEAGAKACAEAQLLADGAILA